MEMKKLLRLNIFGWVEIIIGAIGTFIFSYSLVVFLYSLGRREPFGASIFGLILIAFIPFTLVLLGGIAVIKRKIIARKLNLIILLLVIISSLGILVVKINNYNDTKFELTHPEIMAQRGWGIDVDSFGRALNREGKAIIMIIVISSVLISWILLFLADSKEEFAIAATQINTIGFNIKPINVINNNIIIWFIIISIFMVGIVSVEYFKRRSTIRQVCTGKCNTSPIPGPIIRIDEICYKECIRDGYSQILWFEEWSEKMHIVVH